MTGLDGMPQALAKTVVDTALLKDAISSISDSVLAEMEEIWSSDEVLYPVTTPPGPKGAGQARWIMRCIHLNAVEVGRRMTSTVTWRLAGLLRSLPNPQEAEIGSKSTSSRGSPRE